MKKIPCLVFSVLCFAAAVAAETPACPAAPKDPSAWDKSIAFGFNLSHGNSNTSLLNLDTKVARDFQDENWLFRVEGNYGKDEDKVDEHGGTDETTKQDVKGEVNYKHVLDDRLYAGMGTTVLYDKIADIDYRVTLTPNMGYYFIKDARLKLSADAGPGYIFEKTGGETDNYLAPRISNRLDFKVSETAKIFETTEILFDVNNSENTIINAEAGVEAALNTSLALVLSVKDNFDNVPASDKERNDINFITALKVTL
jgi:putative salt-induced outer membrane protein YdiY